MGDNLRFCPVYARNAADDESPRLIRLSASSENWHVHHRLRRRIASGCAAGPSGPPHCPSPITVAQVAISSMWGTSLG